MVIPVAILKAAVALSLLWDFFTAGLLLGFNGLLRPSEFLLQWRDLILPRGVLSDLPLSYVRIVGGKTCRYLHATSA